jgi:hypothetical protein
VAFFVSRRVATIFKDFRGFYLLGNDSVQHDCDMEHARRALVEEIRDNAGDCRLNSMLEIDKDKACPYKLFDGAILNRLRTGR